MKKFLITLLAATFTLSSSMVYAGPKCPYGEVNGVCIKGEFRKGVLDTKEKYYVVTATKKRNLYREVQVTNKGLVFVGPVLSTIPPAAVVVGAAAIGVVSGAAGVIGSRIGEKIWPRPEVKPVPVAKGWHPGWHGPRPYYHDGGAAVIGGIIGYIVGRNSNPEPPPPPPPPPPPEPSTIVIQPWSPEWYDFCAGKYQSFDAKTGYYIGNDGIKHFCQ